MRIVAAAAALLMTGSLAGAQAPAPKAPTFCAEWVRQSREGYERLTLFADKTLVWKTSRSGKEDIRRKNLPPDEAGFYCAYFARQEFWELAEDFRTKVTGDFAAHSLVQLARPDGSRKQVRFDEFSALTPEGALLRSALDGLKGLFVNPVAPASRFAAERLAPGTVLTRFDGVRFRICGVYGGHAELEGVSEPYRFFMKVEDLRFQFAAPE